MHFLNFFINNINDINIIIFLIIIYINLKKILYYNRINNIVINKR